MTPYGEFVALYMMREHSIINLDRSNPQLVCFINHFQMNCQALESMDVDCTEVHKAIKDVQDAADRLHRVAIEKQLAFFTAQEASISEHLKDYIHGLRLFLGKPADNELAKEPIEKLLILDENGDSVITHAVSSGSVSSLEFLLNQPSCVDALLNLPSKTGNYPLMEAVTNNSVYFVMRLLDAGARIMVPMNRFEDDRVVPFPMLHLLVHALANPAGNTVLQRANEQRQTARILAIILKDLSDPTNEKYSWVHQVGILLVKAIITTDEEVVEESRPMRTAWELARDLGMDQAAQQLADVQTMLCTRCFRKSDPKQINFPCFFLKNEVFHPHDDSSASSISEHPKLDDYYALYLKSLCDLSSFEFLLDAFLYLDEMEEQTDLVSKLKTVIRKAISP